MGLKHYDDTKDAPLFDLLRQYSIKTENQLMFFSDSSWQNWPGTFRIKRVYIILNQGGNIDHVTCVPGPFDKSSAESEFNAECTSGMALARFGMLTHLLLNKYPDIVP